MSTAGCLSFAASAPFSLSPFPSAQELLWSDRQRLLALGEEGEGQDLVAWLQCANS